MKRTTLFVEETVDHELHALARRKGVPVSALVRESLARYVAEQKRGQTFALRFLGQGHSGRQDVAERHEEFLWRGLDPHTSKRRQRGGADATSGRHRRPVRTGGCRRRLAPAHA